MEFFKKLTDIHSAIKMYRMLVIITLIACGVICMVMFIIATNKITRSQEKIYVLSPAGTPYEAESISVKENRPIEAQNHARLFVLNFFEIDKFTYEQKIYEAYDLGNTCIYNFHQKLTNDGWYKNMEQYNIIQSVLIKDIRCTTDSAPYMVEVSFTIKITSEASSDVFYDFDMLLKIEEKGKERTPTNPNALSINDITIGNSKKR